MRVVRFGMATAVAVAIGFSGTSIAAADTAATIVIDGSPARPGGMVTVSGDGCTGPDSIVLVGLLDSDSQSDLAANAVSAAEDGSWSAALTIGAQVAPGSYPVTAKCTNYGGAYNGRGGYGGYEGYDGYDGSGGFDYRHGTVVVLPPLDEPEADGGLIVEPDTIAVGKTAVVTAVGFDSGEQVTAVLYSDPVVLMAGLANSAGEFSATVTIPEGTELGPHTVYAMNAESALHESLILSGSITVIEDTGIVTPTVTTPQVTSTTTSMSTTSAPDVTVVASEVRDATDFQNSGSLAVTGFTVLPFVTLAGALVILGAVLWRRARHHPSSG